MSANRRPQAIVIAGPNGAGKSSAADALLRGRVGADNFVNADVIAAGLNPGNPQAAAIEAGRIMLGRLRDLAAAGTDFAFETTLSGRAYQRFFTSLAVAGYEIEVHYFWLVSPDISVNRVRRRVELGGHDIPLSDIQRRFQRGAENFYRLYRPLASRWFVYSASEAGRHGDVAQGSGVSVQKVHDAAAWIAFQQQVGDNSMTDKPKQVRETAVSRDWRNEAIAESDRNVILRHRAAGVPLVGWRDGKVVEVDPNTVTLPELQAKNGN